MIVSNRSPFPLLLRLLHIRISTISVLMASEMDEVWVSHCGITNSVCEATSWVSHFTNLQLFREDIHSKYLSWSLCIAILTNYAFWSLFFLQGSILYLFHELVLSLFHGHLTHDFFSLSWGKFLLFIILLINKLLQMFFNLAIVLVIFVGQRLDNVLS